MTTTKSATTKSTTRPIRVTPLLAVAALAIAACGGDDDTDSSSQVTPAGSTAAPAGSESPATSESPADATQPTDATETPGEPTTTPAADDLAGAGQSFKVGAILPLTGPAGAIGQDFDTALKIFEEIDPTAAQLDIEFVVCDDETAPEAAAACATRLIQQDQVDMIYGPIIGGTHAAATPVLAGGPPSITSSPYITVEEGDPIFSASGRSTDVDRTTLQFAADRGYQSVAVLATTDTTGETAVQNLERANADLGLELSIERMGPGDVDVSAQVNRLLQSDPEYVYIAASGAAAGVGLQAFDQLGTDLPTALIWSNTTHGFLEAAGPTMPSETLFAVSPAWLPDQLGDPAREELIAEFREAFESRAGTAPSFVVQGAYDGFQLIASALLHAGSDPDAIIAYLEGLTEFQGLNWQLTYSATNHVGAETGNYVMMQYDPTDGTWSLAE